MPRPGLRHVMLLSFAALLLGACQGRDEPAQPGGSSPVAAVQASVDLVKAGDFNGLWKHALPPEDYANLRTDWKRQQDRRPITPADRARFNQALQQLTGPDAQSTLVAELQPKLAAMEQQYKDQLPVLLSVGAALVKKAVAQNRDLTPTQKGQLTDAVDAITPWALQAPWFDQDRAKRAIAVAVTTARKLDLKSPEQVRAMDFDAVMAKYSIAYGGLKRLLAIYGLSVDDTLNSVRLGEVANRDGHAVVKIDYTLAGKPLSTEVKMVSEQGRWYGEDMLKNVRKSHQQLDQPIMVQARPRVAAGSVAGTN